MTSAYPTGQRSSRNNFVEPPSLVDQISDYLPSIRHNGSSGSDPTAKGLAYRFMRDAYAVLQLPSKWQLRRIFNVTNLFIALWVYTIWWGERSVFQRAIESCHWSNWETWPAEATPHHVAFIADPQLVDPHTYPGRPWPISSLTVAHTDKYMRRSYSMLQRNMHPDSLFFLGDLFDGGREWSTSQSTSPTEEFKKYGENFWLREYKRFGDIFFEHWNSGGSGPGLGQRGRRLIATLPGNHDLGFGNGIQEPVRARFNAYFGEGNQVDTLGNHTFVSVDTVSLSAMDQADPQTGSSGSGAGDGTSANGHLWKPVENFLDDVKKRKARAVERDMSAFYSPLFTANIASDSHGLFSQNITDLDDAIPIPRYTTDRSQLYPSILLTHIPLFRSEGTPCGPLREHWPPSSDPPPDRDDRNAIALHGGYQYQNVLTPVVSRDLVTKIGDVVQVYSGDDHDYCEVVHREYTGAVKEITVKSISWAMGVRKPGFLLTSLWNPIDGKSDDSPTPRDTIQNHLCLLPDQLSIFVRYGLLLVFTLVTLLIRAFVVVMRPSSSRSASSLSDPILPLSSQPSTKTPPSTTYHSDASSTSSSSSETQPRLAPRSSNRVAVVRNTSPSRFGGYGLGNSRPPSPSTNADNFAQTKASHVFDESYDDYGLPTTSRARRKKLPPKGLAGVWQEWNQSLRRVALVAIAWYAWVLWNG